MKYRKDKYGNDISVLGFGCMRFPMNLGVINIDEVEKLIMHAYHQGVNYYDTAYIYPGSETALGKVLKKNNIRKDIFIATKLPHYLIKNIEGANKIFYEELHRLQTDYIDYYLMHMLSSKEAWDKLVDMGMIEWINEKKEKGEIKQVGFSYHGNSDMFIEILNAYDWDFCQIQYNYMDEHTQAGVKGLHAAYQKGIPVIIMEPLRGGKLVSKLPEEAKQIFKNYHKQYQSVEWALKWLWNQKEVTCVLSGMNVYEHLVTNIHCASSTSINELDQEDLLMLKDVSDKINAKMKVGCTACGYCQPCPKNVDIPAAFAAYNRQYSESKFWGFADYLMTTALKTNPTSASLCIGCGKCEKHCPQHIQIRNELKNVSKALENPIYKLVIKLNKIFKIF